MAAYAICNAIQSLSTSQEATRPSPFTRLLKDELKLKEKLVRRAFPNSNQSREGSFSSA